MRSGSIRRGTEPKGPGAISEKDDRATRFQERANETNPREAAGVDRRRERTDAEAKPRTSCPNERECRDDLTSKGPADERPRTRRSSLPTDNRRARRGGRSFSLAQARRPGVRAGPSLEWGGRDRRSGSVAAVLGGRRIPLS